MGRTGRRGANRHREKRYTLFWGSWSSIFSLRGIISLVAGTARKRHHGGVERH